MRQLDRGLNEPVGGRRNVRAKCARALAATKSAPRRCRASDRRSHSTCGACRSLRARECRARCVPRSRRAPHPWSAKSRRLRRRSPAPRRRTLSRGAMPLRSLSVSGRARPRGSCQTLVVESLRLARHAVQDWPRSACVQRAAHPVDLRESSLAASAEGREFRFAPNAPASGAYLGRDFLGQRETTSKRSENEARKGRARSTEVRGLREARRDHEVRNRIRGRCCSQSQAVHAA
jgi:hypothetical protein